MAPLEWHSESREWYRAAALVLGMMLASRTIVRNAVEGPLLAELNLDLLFLLIALPGLWLVAQGYRLRDGRGTLLQVRGEELLTALEQELLAAGFTPREKQCVFAPSFGLWQQVGRLTLPDGEAEVKEIWLSAFFWRSQVALRGSLDEAMLEQSLARLADYAGVKEPSPARQ
ncbi:MAG: hypothetical protein CL960_04415 [Euryarchaeota archaeon]|jgi:hypothetical protein|nr:hypothetical protein [Euryarchaeota archaeon]MDP6364215.1 hypothetical protein [Candidatus Poseidoniia archaeon]MDP6659201.1 hypothetical protein [Candidatus Poseidoniia archaeon]MDP6847022.1 hypothetical protein [Candidatus Poseidoniia archaeon]MDP7007761.1 hypothetical protein [Candidatus Poseidoniia archaeon]|tara:strand:- start:1472 stop:1987 length:516 start_codon:yes stop_codon:yes gene_type:complete